GSREVQGGDPHQADPGGRKPDAGAQDRAGRGEGAAGLLPDRGKDLAGPVGAVGTIRPETIRLTPLVVEINRPLTTRRSLSAVAYSVIRAPRLSSLALDFCKHSGRKAGDDRDPEQ